MKNIFKYITCCCLSWMGLAACGDLNDVHKEYLAMGEETYVGRADSLQANGGFKRIELKWMLNADPKISKCIITWEGNDKPIAIPIDHYTEGYLSKIIDMPEGKYIFTIYTQSESGKTSLTQTVSGEVYGDKYQSRLSQKGIQSISADPKGAVITWLPEEGCIGVNLSYVNKDGVTKKLYVAGDAVTTTIADFVLGSKLSMSSVYKPEKNAIDEIQTLESNLYFPKFYTISKTDWDNLYHADYKDVDRTGWTAEANTEELVGEGDVNGRAMTLLDGNYDTFWHSQWKDASPAPVLPHIIIIDMKRQQDIISVELARRKDNKDVKTVAFSISNDKQTWTDFGELSFPNSGAPNAKIVLLSKTINGRYIRVMVTESNNAPHASLSEIMFTTK